EITALGNVDAEIVEYTLGNHPRAAGRLLSQMALPESAVVAMITRGSTVIPPRGSTRLYAGDHLFVVLKPETRAFVDCVFSQALDVAETELPNQELRLKGSTRIEDVRDSYGIELDAEMHLTLDQFLKQALGEDLNEGAELVRNNLVLAARELLRSRITTVGLRRAATAE